MTRMRSRVSGVSLGLGGLWVLAVTLGGGWVTRLGSWYQALDKPAWQPPDWLFAPVWTVLFALAAVAAVVAWNARSAAPDDRARLAGVYLLNGALNVGWSFLFFRLQRPDWAVWEAMALGASVVFMMIWVGEHSRWAPWLLAPYLGWVCFAVLLNLAVVRLNAPFAGG